MGYSLGFYIFGSSCGAFQIVGLVWAIPAYERLRFLGVFRLTKLKLLVDFLWVVLFGIFIDEMC